MAATLQCSCAHADSFSVYPPWLITHGYLFISCFSFYALAIRTVCSVLLIVVTVFQQSSRLTQFTAGYECRKYGSSTHQREMKSLWGKSGQSGAVSWLFFRLIAGFLAKIPNKVERGWSKLSITAKALIVTLVVSLYTYYWISDMSKPPQSLWLGS